jgi:hypothetical protein
MIASIRTVSAFALLFAVLIPAAGWSQARSREDLARQLHERRQFERTIQQREQLRNDLTPERSRPVPPKSSNSQVVPNR